MISTYFSVYLSISHLMKRVVVTNNIERFTVTAASK